MFMWSISLCIVLLLITALVHSIGGEKYLLRPLFKHRGNRVLESALARVVLRFAWHVTSLMWVLLAVLIYTYGFARDELGQVLLFSVAITFVFVGLFDLAVSRGKHIGWPLLLLIGVCAGLALLAERGIG